MNYLVIYPGRFHPFHLGHKASYDYLVNKYGPESVYIATSDKQAPVSSPFSYSDKVEMMTKLGVPASHIVKVRNPYRADEITQDLTAEQQANTVLIFAVSAKDAKRFDFKPKKDGSPSYIQPLPTGKKKLKPMTVMAYVDITPTVNFKVRGQDANSATVVRQLFIDGNDTDRDQIITDLYGSPDSSLRDMFKQRLGITDRVVRMMQECRRIGTARSLTLMERVLHDERVALNEFVPDPKYFGGDPDGFPRRPQKFKKGDVVWVAKNLGSMMSHFANNCPAVVMYSYESEYGNSEGYVYVEADPDDEDYQEYVADAKAEANREHDYGLFILAKGDVGETAWYPEGSLVLIPKGTDPVALCSRGNAAPYATLPARAKKLLARSLGTTLKEFAPDPSNNNDDDVPPDVYKLANRWWNNTDDQDRIAMMLRSQGWDICQADGEEDVCQLTYRDGSVYYLNDSEFDPDLYENSDYIEEKWSAKYKRSIDCGHPRGFSQKAHCAGRKK